MAVQPHAQSAGPNLHIAQIAATIGARNVRVLPPSLQPAASGITKLSGHYTALQPRLIDSSRGYFAPNGAHMACGCLYHSGTLFENESH